MPQSYVAPFYSPRYLVASGTDTYTGSVTGYVAYAAGDTFDVLFTNANTGAATLNINSLGPIALKKNGTAALVPGDIDAGSLHQIVYDGTNFQIVATADSATVAQLNTGTDNSAAATSLGLNTSKYGAATNLYLFNNYI